jgi:hypothetical protein
MIKESASLKMYWVTLSGKQQPLAEAIAEREMRVDSGGGKEE